MIKTYSQRSELKCPISGATTNILRCRPIPYEAADDKDTTVASQEWVFGLPRGGLSYYLKSRENGVCFREDICRMYSRGEFILAPTLKTYLDAMNFMEHSGIKNRKDDDRSPRRPLTALASPEGLYRYVFLPFTDAARALQKEFNMQPQTEADLNWGINPALEEPCLEGSEQFPVVECYAHPFSVSVFADKMFWDRSTELTAQWHGCLYNLVSQWRLKRIAPPQWFFDEPKFGEDDSDLSGTEASGYLLCTPADVVPEPVNILRDSDIADDNYRKKAALWVSSIGPEFDPIEENPPPEPVHSPVQLRRSERLRNRYGPYTPPSPPRKCPTSPARRAPWPPARSRDPVHRPPAWVKRNGCFPTSDFSSNDWAYFRYGVALAAPMDT
ncbi:hypothetical protein BD626DRAFT_406174 [Schizophyllum amplum]|uniref:Uncharacterized protein n=1 Tax=Schizophyllum amplum TaxID=97359 RepID=A0A550C988_9AGAR|nr:hypothetical protein BD626DRAFT_406174 [Auriculariopsis ampla]